MEAVERRRLDPDVVEDLLCCSFNLECVAEGSVQAAKDESIDQIMEWVHGFVVTGGDL